jgi:hypothetical protein
MFLYAQMNNPNTEILDNPLTHIFEQLMEAHSELSEFGKRKLIKQRLMDTPPPEFIDFEKLTDSHFMLFILSLSDNNNVPPSFSTYTGHRAGFNHLYTIYRIPKPPVLNSEISLYYKGNLKNAISILSIEEKSCRACSNRHWGTS